MTEPIGKAPFVGPRPFEREDEELFFGRDREALSLSSLVFRNRVITLFAESGAGKTSLLNAKLVPILEKDGFDVLPVARVRGLIPTGVDLSAVDNPYVLNSLLSWTEEARFDDLLNVELADYLDRRGAREDEFGEPLPRLIVFDQFEEIFTSYADRWPKRRDFFEQVVAALARDKRLRVIFSMREDYVARVGPYAHLFEQRLEARFHLERLREGAALASVKGPLSRTSRKFGDGVAEQLVRELMKVNVENALGEPVEVQGEFVEPVQLQVVCESLWRDLPDDVEVITAEMLAEYGDVDEVIADFYEDSLEKVLAEPRAKVKESQLRRWFGQVLITPAGTRGTVYQGKNETGGIPNRMVKALDEAHIIRGEYRAGSRWYEISHDRFIEPILRSNRSWFRAVGGQLLDRLEARAEEWAGKDPDKLLTREELREAETWLVSSPEREVDPSDEVLALIRESRAVVERRSNRWLRVGIAALLLLFSAAVFATLQAVREAKASKEARQAAEDARGLAEEAKAKADENQKAAEALARLQGEIAKDAGLRAEFEKTRAEEEGRRRQEEERLRREAQRSSRIYLARNLAYQAEDSRDAERALLLSVEAVARNHDPITDRSLRTALADRRAQVYAEELVQRSAEETVPLTVSPTGRSRLQANFMLAEPSQAWTLERAREAWFSSDGSAIARIEADDREVVVRDATEGSLVARVRFEQPVRSFALSPGGTFVGAALAGGAAVVRDTRNDQPKWVRNDLSEPVILALSAEASRMAVRSRDQIHILGNDPQSFRLDDPGPVVAAAFRNDGGALAIAAGQAVTLWRKGARPQVRRLEHSSQVSSLAFSGDGEHLASGSKRGASIWRIEDGQELVSLRYDDAVEAVAFDSTSRYFASVSPGSCRRADPGTGAGCGGRLILYRGEDLIAYACEWVGGPLTREDWLASIGKQEEYRPQCLD